MNRILLALTIQMAAISLCSAQAADDRSRAEERNEPTLADNSAELHFRGVIRPYRRVVLRSPIDSQVLQLSAQVGQAVTAESILVQLDTKSLESELRLAEEQLEKVRAELKVCQAGLKQMDRSSDQLREGRQEVEQRLDFARRPQSPPGYPGRVVNGTSDVMGSPMREKAIDRVREALDDVDANRVRLRSNRGRLLSLRDELQRWEHGAEAAVRVAQKRLDEANVTASVQGIVAKSFVESSERVKAGDELVEIIQTDRIKATLWLPGTVAADFDFGAFPWKARVRTSNTETSWHTGIVRDVPPLPHPRTEMAMLEVEVDNEKGLLRPGMWVDAVLETSDVAQASRKRSLQ